MIGKPRGAFDLVAACAVNSDSSDPYLPALFSALLAQRGPGQNNPKPFGGEPPISLKNSDRVLHLVDCAGAKPYIGSFRHFEKGRETASSAYRADAMTS